MFSRPALHTFASHTSRHTTKACKRVQFIQRFYYICSVKIISFIIAFYVLLLATVPCYLEDKCLSQSNHTEQSQDDQDEQGCSDCCSPFLSCGTCSGFTFPLLSFSLKACIVLSKKSISIYDQSFISEFHSSIWQPPKIS